MAQKSDEVRIACVLLIKIWLNGKKCRILQKIVTIRTKPYCINKKSREIIRETFYNNKESSILFLQMGYLHEDFVVHT